MAGDEPDHFVKKMLRWECRHSLADDFWPVGVGHFAAGLVSAFVGVSTEEVALGLQEIRGKHGATVAVVVTEGGAEGGDGNAGEGGQGNDFAPIFLESVEEICEEWGEHQVFQLGIGAVGVCDVVEETGTNDAATTPDGGDFSEVEVPAFFRTHGGDEVETLGVGDDLGGEECVVDFFDQHLFLEVDIGLGSIENLDCGDALVLHGGQDAGFYCGVDGGNDNCVFDRIDECPLAGAFLAGGVEDEINEGFLGFRIDLGEDLGGDLDEVGLEVAFVPLGEDFGEFFGFETGGFENIVSFANQLHIAVFDAVVDHLDVVAGTAGADVEDAGLTIDLRGDGFEDWLHDFPSGSRAARHDGRAFPRPFLAAGDTRADEAEAEIAQPFVTALGVGVQRISPVDDDISLV